MLTCVIIYSDFLVTANNPIPTTESTTGIIQENVCAPARIRLVASIGIICPPIGKHASVSVITGPTLHVPVPSHVSGPVHSSPSASQLVLADTNPLSAHPNANPASIAAECANEQGKFWEYHDVLFDKQSQWQSLGTEDFTTNAKQFASDIGLESASFESCLSSSETASKVSKDSLDAASYGATGTPTFFIGNEKNGFVKIVGAQPFAAFEAEINSQLG